jgi:hypothetical protein
MHGHEQAGQAMTLTKTTARNAKERRWRRVIGLGFWVDTLWALKRLTSLTSLNSGDREREVWCLGERALLVFKDDVLVMCGVKKPKLAGQEGERGTAALGGVDSSPQPFVSVGPSMPYDLDQEELV